MDLFQHRYYRSNRTLMTLIGQWPYQSNGAKYCFRAVLLYMNTSEIIFRILDIVKNRDDYAILLDCAVPLFADLGTATVLIILMSNSRTTLQLLNRIRTDWQVWARHPEVKILHEYAEQGRKMNIALTGAIYLAAFIDLTALITAKLIDDVLMNGTEPGKFPTRVYYHRIDTQKYYFYVMMYYSVAVFIVMTVAVASISTMVTYVQHACGIFAALGQKLERIGNDDAESGTRQSGCALRKREVVHLAWCIDRHNDAIEYANLIEDYCTWLNGFGVFIGMFLLNVVGLQVLTSTHDFEATARSIAFAFGLLLILIMACLISQQLLDHSINIRFYIYNNEWYRLSVEAQKLVQLMTMRCTVPCHMSAAKIFIMSMNTCGLIIKTAASYFTLLRSTRGV